MNIKNYTSSVSADQSITQIERVLVKMGARNVAKEYDEDGKVDAILFSIPRGESVVPIKLPARRAAIKKVLLNQYKRKPTASQEENATQQADRTAWRNVKDWVEIQATMIELDQVEILEVFMPYIYNLAEKKTVFEIARDTNFRKLLS